MLKSGVHAALAGVLIAFTIPLRGRPPASQSPLRRVGHDFQSWAAILVLPVFTFANAGISFEGIAFSDLAAPVQLGIALELFLGKQLGVFGVSYALVKPGLVRLPADVTWWQVYGLACLTGVGFTMSLFIGTLAFDTSDQLKQVRMRMPWFDLRQGQAVRIARR